MQKGPGSTSLAIRRATARRATPPAAVGGKRGFTVPSICFRSKRPASTCTRPSRTCTAERNGDSAASCPSYESGAGPDEKPQGHQDRQGAGVDGEEPNDRSTEALPR